MQQDLVPGKKSERHSLPCGKLSKHIIKSCGRIRILKSKYFQIMGTNKIRQIFGKTEMKNDQIYFQQLLSSVWPEWRITRFLGKGSYGSVYEIQRDDLGNSYKCALKVLHMEAEGSPYESYVNSDFGMSSSKSESGNAISYTSTSQFFRQGSVSNGEKTFKSGIAHERDTFQNTPISDAGNGFSKYEELDDFVRDVSTEINMMMQLKGSPNIVGIEDYAVLSGAGSRTILIRMELLESLDQYCKRCGSLSREEVVRLGLDICSALEFCEQKNILHRDIKPSNIFYREQFGFKLGDFGISRTMSSISSKMSMTGIGTIQFMAPEVYSGHKYNNTIDIYSLGIVLYTLMNNSKPPLYQEGQGDNDPSAERIKLHEANMRRLRGETIPLPVNAADRLGNAICTACNPDPISRFQTAREFLNALRDVSEEPPIGDPPPGHPLGHKKQIIVAIAGICILSIAIILLQGTFKHNTVSYTVIYEDESGHVLDKKTGTGKPGSKITEAGISYDGYALLSEPIELVLSTNEEKNVIHLRYKTEDISETVTYTVLSTDMNGATLARQVKEGAVGEEISESPPDIEGYHCSNSAKSIILSKTSEENAIVFLYERANTSTSESEMVIPSDAITYGGHSYYLYDNDCKNWDDVLSFCEDKGGYPAVINDSEENEMLYEYMLSMGRKAALIGYSDRETEGLWKWVEGKNSTFTDWGTNNEGELEPNSDSQNEDYAQLDINMNNGHWNDCAFGWDTKAFFCEWDGIKQSEGQNTGQEGSEAAANPSETDVDSNPAPLAVTDDVLCMYAKDAASFLRLTEKAEYHEPDIEYASYYYIQKGQDLFDGSSYLEYFPEYDMTGHWNLYIGDKSISFQGVTIGMEYSKAKSILHSNGWSYDEDSDEDVEADDSIYYEKDLPNDWTYGFVNVEFEDGKVKSIEFFTDGD